jgi:hypothetical protein
MTTHAVWLNYTHFGIGQQGQNWRRIQYNLPPCRLVLPAAFMRGKRGTFAAGTVNG